MSNDSESHHKNDSMAPSTKESDVTNPPHKQRDSSSSYLTHKVSVDRQVVYELLKNMADELKFYYSCIETKSSVGPRFCQAATMIWRTATIVKPISDQTGIKAQDYDFSPETPGNGMRSIISIVDISVLHLLRILKEIREQRTGLLFRGNYYVKELEAYVSAFVVLVKAVQRVHEYLPSWPKNDLFMDFNSTDRRLIDLMSEIELLDQSPFFGRTMGFQFCASLSRVFQLIGISLASYSLLWDHKRPAATSLTGAASNLLTSGQYVINPEERARRIYQVTINADISFCKAFWNLTEGPLLQELPRWMNPHPAVNEIWHVPGELALQLETLDGRQLEVPPPSAHTGPRSVPIRVISYQLREGMPTPNVLRVFKGTSGKRVLPPSPCVLFHVHGGGFVATSSKTHEPYLRHWAKSLNCPIVSIDYSLSPENPYPRAAEEIYYAYAWVLANAERLGWTGERICFAGDSAGGLLLASTVLRLIKRGIRRLPDGLVLIYPAFLVQYSPSPSRLLSLLDPLLPLGIVARCLAAYTGNFDYLKSDDPNAAPPHDPAMSSPTAQTSSEPPRKKTLRDTVNNQDEQKREVPGSTEGDQKVLNFIKGTLHPAKSPTGTEIATEASSPESQPGTVAEASTETPKATAEPSKAAHSIQPSGNGTPGQPNFVLASSSSSDEDEEDEQEQEQDTDQAELLTQFFHRQLSRTSGKGVNVQKEIHVSTADGIEVENGQGSGQESPSTESIPESEDSASSSIDEIPTYDPGSMIFSSSCFDESFVGYLRDQELTKWSFRQFTVPLKMSSRPHRPKEESKAQIGPVMETKAASAPAVNQTNGQLRSQSSGSLANLTWASAAIGQKMGLYVMDNLSGWFNGGYAFDSTNILNTNDTAAGSSAPAERVRLTSPLSKFHDMPIPHDPFLSPLLAPEDWLTRFPRTAIVACHLDPLLDDGVSFAKHLKQAGVDVSVDLLDALPHGFLNFAMFSAECREGSRVCVQRMREILKISRDRS